MRWVAAIAALLLAGCGVFDAAEEKTGAEWYGEVGVAYQIDSNSDELVRTTQSYQCSDNFQAHFEAGLDWGNTRVGYHHQSWWSCGRPFNSKAELYQDDIRIVRTFGGK